MPLCFMEGPEGGTGKALGRKPLMNLGEFVLSLSFLNLEPWLKPT